MSRAMSKKKPAPARPRSSNAAAIAALAVFVIIAAVWFWKSSQPSQNATAAAAASPPSAPAAGSAAPFAGRSYPSQGHTHLSPSEPDDFVYNSNPPTSGPHKELFSDQFVNPDPLPVYVQVHLLEHGNVLLQYDCSCPDVVSSLSAIAYEYDSKLIAPSELQPRPDEVQNGEDQGRAVIVAPYPHMKSRIALTAWTRLATLQTVDKPNIESFIGLYLSNAANASQ
jgi:Protein of unknown function (DUF3105)